MDQEEIKDWLFNGPNKLRDEDDNHLATKYNRNGYRLVLSHCRYDNNGLEYKDLAALCKESGIPVYTGKTPDDLYRFSKATLMPDYKNLLDVNHDYSFYKNFKNPELLRDVINNKQREWDNGRIMGYALTAIEADIRSMIFNGYSVDSVKSVRGLFKTEQRRINYLKEQESFLNGNKVVLSGDMQAWLNAVKDPTTKEEVLNEYRHYKDAQDPYSEMIMDAIMRNPQTPIDFLLECAAKYPFHVANNPALGMEQLFAFKPVLQLFIDVFKING